MVADFILGFGAGIAATPHCLGMCGGFPLHLARPGSRGTAALRQVLFVGGKCFTYMFLGALAASLGVILLKNTRFAEAAPALRVAAGAITLVFGLAMLGLRWPFNRENAKGRKSERGENGSGASGFEWSKAERKSRNAGNSPLVTLLHSLLASPGPGAALVLGLGVGFLPCPLPIGMLAVAAGLHSVPHGIALMAGVGLGTAPGLLGAGLFGMGLDWRLKRTGIRAAGVVVVLIGALTLYRATGLMPRHHVVNSIVPTCCQEHVAK